MQMSDLPALYHHLSSKSTNNDAMDIDMQRREYHFWVYILASRSRNLYVGMTDNLVRRGIEHRSETGGVHTARYSIHRLVYYEYFRYVRSAIRRETELKRWTREMRRWS